MRKIGLIFIILLLSNTAFADLLEVPFGCYPKVLQEEFKKEGFKLDLDANERTKDSWGFIVSKGSEYLIYTYYPIKREDRNWIFPLFTKIMLRGQDG